MDGEKLDAILDGGYSFIGLIFQCIVSKKAILFCGVVSLIAELSK